jgi:hypothetical protein
MSLHYVQCLREEKENPALKVFRVLTFLCLILTAIAAYGMFVKTDYDMEYDFSRLKAFAFKEQHRSDSDPLRTDTVIDDRIRNALRGQLEARGFQYQPEGQPDFLIAFTTHPKEKMETEDLSYDFPLEWRWGWAPEIWTRYRTEGSVIVDFATPQTNLLIWRGIATDVVQTGREKSEKQINKGADELVKHFLKDTRRKDTHKKIK